MRLFQRLKSSVAHCRSLLPRHFMSSVFPAVSMKANGFYIVALTPGNCLTPALLSDIALLSAVWPFRAGRPFFI